MSKPPEPVDNALDGARLSAAHWKLWALSAFGVALDGFDFFIIGVALPLIAKDFNATPMQVGAIGAAAVLGAVLGAAGCGSLADRVGRKAMYLMDLFAFLVFTALSALAWDVTSLIVFRFLLGVGIGADYPISACYVSETMPARVRGRMTSAAIGFQAVGMICGAVAGLLCMLVVHDVSAWRWMLALGIVPALVVMLLRRSVPESPRWLESHGHGAEAAAALAELHCAFTPTPKTEGTVAVLSPLPQHTWRALWSVDLRRRTILACVPWFLMDIATYGVGLFTPTILMVLTYHGHTGDGSPTSLTREIASVEGAIFLDVFLIVGFLLSIALIDRIGRMRLQIAGFLAMALGLVILTIAGTEQPNLVLIFGGFILFNTMMNAGPNTTTYVLPAEIFPTSIRATAHGLASAVGKVGAAVGIFFLPILRSALGLSPTLLLVSIAALLGAAVTWTLAIETNGRSLGEFELKE